MPRVCREPVFVTVNRRKATNKSEQRGCFGDERASLPSSLSLPLVSSLKDVEDEGRDQERCLRFGDSFSDEKSELKPLKVWFC